MRVMRLLWKVERIIKSTINKTAREGTESTAPMKHVKYKTVMKRNGAGATSHWQCDKNGKQSWRLFKLGVLDECT